MDSGLSKRLISLADKYENISFLEKDPSQFMHNYKDAADIEAAAFIAANLAFGRRDQILLHVKAILDAAGSSPARWIADNGYESFFQDSDSSFYRMFSHRHMKLFCRTLSKILNREGTLGNYFRQEYQKACSEKAIQLPAAHSGKPLLSSIISGAFPGECPVVAHGKDSACKKIHMFLRWMVRNNSPVDLGLWTSWYDKTDLLMPLDTHVMQQSAELGLLALTKAGKSPAPSLKTAKNLTDAVREVFPDDPVRADFALFGLGADD
ncbi:MAG: TIGR02757 family protein [Treponema sp.]|nr:TIGR02757 family protein [Treponema sp.]